mmetsp:Transcript_31923/g.77792  ORF Transcript_31923/g.77792 Transcript_31923/m.77792 type:complete len:428 (+) Transcript_31923:105-1388(+)
MSGPPSARECGTIKSYKVEKGYGFIGRHGVDADVFFHVSNFRKTKNRRQPEIGMQVEYGLGLSNQGKECAKDIIEIEDDGKRRRCTRGSDVKICSEMDGRQRGVVSSIRGKYGFIIEPKSQKKIFFFMKDVHFRDPLTVGENVDFVMVNQNVVGLVALNIRPFLIQHENFPQDETRKTEFKSMVNSNAPERSIATVCSKYNCAFLNSSGGKIYFGIEDDGKIFGINLTKYQRDIARKDLDFQMKHYDPPVDPDRYSIAFLKIYQRTCGDLMEVPDQFVVRVTVLGPTEGAGSCNFYKDPSGNPWIRLDGSVAKMDPQMFRKRRAKEDGEENDKKEIQRLRAQIQRLEKGERQRTSSVPLPHNEAKNRSGSNSRTASARAISNHQVKDKILASLLDFGYDRKNVLDALEKVKRANQPLHIDAVLDKLM